ncbi:SDR family NAD(P)-dependent oxidoreductase [Nocardia coubleae]|uniref:SDR family NAD(P)-dependent oxidoreductase n=1 Tax=Nocardia coubleae TaxID=356147 RepID=A0A846W138_9NOCA|nr:SDR family NAD(P)-dependent oxidoreductase [Nocardia coubleae]NKX86841.1 SDR family NAD(P)-dependent oxidoreductase [Nocardia coubleae]
MKYTLVGRVVVVTGGARGIGLTLATELVARGALVAIGDIDDSALEGARSASRAALAGRLDVTDPESWGRFLDSVESELGLVDVLINNAGIMPAGPLLSEPDGVTRRIFEINSLGGVLGAKFAMARMVPRGGGHIVTIASTMGESAVPGLATYNASKAASIRFADAARLEFRRSGVLFSCVLPGAVNTELATGIRGPKGVPNVEPVDVAEAVVAALESGRSRPRIYVPRSFGVLLRLQQLLPRRVGEALARALGAEDAVLRDSDLTARLAYNTRVGRS